ncbi:hypothetical protein WT58_24020 [Burkholderia territorii]|nr:hypothetical protein WT58_24020 [Burkholderia territorii]
MQYRFIKRLRIKHAGLSGQTLTRLLSRFHMEQVVQVKTLRDFVKRWNASSRKLFLSTTWTKQGRKPSRRACTFSLLLSQQLFRERTSTNV